MKDFNTQCRSLLFWQEMFFGHLMKFQAEKTIWYYFRLQRHLQAVSFSDF